MQRVFKVENVDKRTVVELAKFEKDGDTLIVESLWRSGAFIIIIDEDTEVPNWDELDYLSLDTYEYYLDHTLNGEYTEVRSKGLTEEAISELEAIVNDEGNSGLYDAGWEEDDTQYFIDGPVAVVEITGTEEAEMYIG